MISESKMKKLTWETIYSEIGFIIKKFVGHRPSISGRHEEEIQLLTSKYQPTNQFPNSPTLKQIANSFSDLSVCLTVFIPNIIVWSVCVAFETGPTTLACVVCFSWWGWVEVGRREQVDIFNCQCNAIRWTDQTQYIWYLINQWSRSFCCKIVPIINIRFQQ